MTRIRILMFYPSRIQGSKRHRIRDPQHCEKSGYNPVSQIKYSGKSLISYILVRMSPSQVALEKREKAVEEVRWMQEVLKRQLEEEARLVTVLEIRIRMFLGVPDPDPPWVRASVADPGCLSRILIFTHSGSRIADPVSKNSNKREGRKKSVVKATNFTKLKIISFYNDEEKNVGQFSKNYRTFYPKICH